MKKLLMLSVAAFALAAPAAFAEEGKDAPPPPPHHKGEMFEKIDTDKDGAISKAEFIAFHEARFAEMDKDGDGKVTKEEGEAHRAAMKAKWKEGHPKAGDAPVEAPVEAPAEAPPAAP